MTASHVTVCVQLVPEFLSEMGIQRPDAHFAFGPPYSSSPMKFHASSWHAVAHGAVMWWLLPPAHAFYAR